MHWAIRNAGLRVSGGIQIVNMVLTEKVLSGFFCLCTSFLWRVYLSLSTFPPPPPLLARMTLFVLVCRCIIALKCQHELCDMETR